MMLEAMAARGMDHVEIWRDDVATLAVGRYDWEMHPAFSGSALIVSNDRHVVAADATLYYRQDLKAAMDKAGVAPASDSPGHLILAALEAWGEKAPEYLDGEVAFIAWDRVVRRVICARDFSGKRPLHYAEPGDELVVASTIAGVRSHPRCPQALNLAVIAGTASGLIFGAGPETCYSAIRALPSAHRLVRTAEGRARVDAYWEPPIAFGSSRLNHEDAAVHLRELLAAATLERLPGDTDTSTVWMSGGWDSSAIFGAARHAADRDGGNRQVLPVSISYPEGDPGREDEWIQAIADRWQVPVRWINIDDIPFLDDEPARAAQRDEPYAHLYSHWNSALARGTRACGSRVALDGNGGDQLFANSDVFLADLLRQGRLLTLAREWPSRNRGGFRSFFGTVIQPNLPGVVLEAAAILRGGRRLRHYLERPVAPWIRPEFATRHRLQEHDHAFLGRDIRGHAAREIDWMFTCQFVSRAFSLLGSLALQNGVELRSPLADRRVIEFALARPWWERSSGKETKLLLRRSMEGLLPEEVLAPRTHRTGITGGYSHRWMRDVFPALARDTMGAPMLLEDLGILDANAFRNEVEGYARSGGWNAFTRVNLFYTLQTELWLRAHAARTGTAAPHAERAVAVPS